MDIRKEFLTFFEDKKHKVIQSAPLVPDDATLLFINAGMVQFKDIFTGSIPTPSNPRATSCQLCVRAGGKHNDLENVGYTARHHTLFEMLGNFSFGDYFKKEAIANAWEFITVNLALPIDKLWVTIHNSDDEAYDLWKEHISEERIKRFGDKDNFWSMGDTGACGPCSEIFYDQGAKNFNTSEDYLGGEGDRFLEIWNLVFMQYERDTKGVLNPLPKPSIDTGMGLERVIAIKENKINNYDSSLFTPIIEQIQKLSPTIKSSQNIASFRVIADHIRTVSFMLSQGILFDKVGRGYVLRRILRRAVRHGYLLGFKEAFMADIVDILVRDMGIHYTQLKEQQNFIKEQITLEEQRFFKTIASGMQLFNEELKNTKDIFDGQIAFKLYDTHGFPLDLTQDMLREKNLGVDMDMFEQCMTAQKTKAKAAWKGSGDDAKDGDFKAILDKIGINKFVGYEHTSYNSTITALLDENFKQVDILEKNTIGWVMLDNTPFYATSGGQVGDIGALEDDEHIAIIKQTKKFFGLNLSQVEVTSSTLKIDQQIKAVVINRDEIQKHHSATHLLQSALKIVLGDTVSQAGSLNDATKLRFDFTYSKAMNDEQINEVQNLVNNMIAQAIQTKIEELPIEQAKTKGAIAMFGEKYGNMVRVVEFGDDSVEFCGGTHVQNTANIGSFYIVKESGVSSGVRRIEAVCGKSAISYTQSYISQIHTIENELKTKDILQSVKKLKEHIKELKDEVIKGQNSNAKPLEELMIKDTKVIVEIISNGDIKNIIDNLKNKNDKIAIMLLQIKDDKVLLASGVKNSSIKAGDWIKNIAPIVGGGGGGRADFAQAGGKDISKVQDAKIKALEYLEQNL
jgi:alanyl-tRNA synthetase